MLNDFADRDRVLKCDLECHDEMAHLRQKTIDFLENVARDGVCALASIFIKTMVNDTRFGFGSCSISSIVLLWNDAWILFAMRQKCLCVVFLCCLFFTIILRII